MSDLPSLDDLRRASPVLGEVGELIGVPLTMRLIETRGGDRLAIPKDSGSDTQLVALLGADSAAALARAFGGTSVVLPTGARLAQARVAGLDDGTRSAGEVARSAGVHIRTVYRRRAKDQGAGQR